VFAGDVHDRPPLVRALARREREKRPRSLHGACEMTPSVSSGTGCGMSRRHRRRLLTLSSPPAEGKERDGAMLMNVPCRFLSARKQGGRRHRRP
jgi:hypothetical protein